MSWRLRQIDVTASTNDDVRRAAERGEPEGLVVYARKQTSGRGRHGRIWDSPEGNLYCSVLLRPTNEKELLGLYSFVAVLAVYDTVSTYVDPLKARLKWPNDVLVEGKKISGILIEAGEDYLVMGVGLNLAHHPDTGLYPTTSLEKEAGHSFEVSDILPRLLECLSFWYKTLQRNGFGVLREKWLVHAHQGAMRVRLPQETLEGVFMDLDLQGRLHLRLADGSERAIATGDVFPVF